MRNIYELIAEHNQIFKHHYSDLRIASPPDMHIAKQASAEMKSSLSFLAAVLWVLLQPIRETKSHPRQMCGLAMASIRT